MDQPFINYHAISLGLYNNTLLNQFVSLYEDNEIVTNYETSIICHFSFPIGNFGHKNERMKKFMCEIMKETKGAGNENIGLISNGKYTWNSGFIEILEGGIIKTTWGNGVWKMLKGRKILVSWNGFEHILKLNDICDEYISVRIVPVDFEIVFGDRV
jgi:hypothetical protein